MNGPCKQNNERGPGVKEALRDAVPLLTIAMIAGLLMTTISGCGSSSTPPVPAAAKRTTANVPVSTSGVAVETKTEGQAVPLTLPGGFTYNPEDRRDPFRSIVTTTETAKNLESLPPLQRTELEDLRLIGIVWGGFGYSAMVQTPDGKGYTIHVGTLVGPNRGAVRRITNRYLVIEEKYTDVFGEKKTREVKLDLLPQKEGSE